jgi:hypothetical protein
MFRQFLEEIILIIITKASNKASVGVTLALFFFNRRNIVQWVNINYILN